MKPLKTYDINTLWTRHQPKQSRNTILKAGIGGFIAVATLAILAYVSDNIFLMAPFGATCVLLFSVPQSPLSQPINVFAGHLVSTLIGLLLNMVLPMEWWSLGLAVGLAISVMALLRVTHPPAGADPLVVFFESLGFEYLVFPVAFGSLILIAVAWVFHRIPPREVYPIPRD